jgi:hypothetical protein
VTDLIKGVQYPIARESRVEIEDLSIMTRAATTPLRAQTSLGNYYIKAFDPIRLFGLELFNTLWYFNTENNNGLPNIRMDYWFTQADIIEREIGGQHEHEMNKRTLRNLRQNPKYIQDRIMGDVWLIEFGLDDIFSTASYGGRTDNYKVLPDGHIAIIDFDMFSPRLTRIDTNRRKQETAAELGMKLSDYDKIYINQLALLDISMKRNTEGLARLCQTLESMPRWTNPEIGRIVQSIRGKIE